MSWRKLYCEGTVETRFWKYVRKTRTCWLWIGGMYPDGYGKFRIQKMSGAWCNVRAHRLSFLLNGGRVGSEYVLHSCDNRACVNPDHLRRGTQQENIAEMIAKGRGIVGEKNGQARLRAADVVRMRRLRKSGMTYKEIGAFFPHVTIGHIGNVLRGLRWGY